MLAVGAGRRTILAIAGDVEDRTELILQLQGLGDQLFGAGIVVDGGHHRKRLFRLRTGLRWGGAWNSRWLRFLGSSLF
jgi:hypothetical protein